VVNGGSDAGTVMLPPPGDVSTVAGTGQSGFKDGPGASAQFSNPTGIAADGQGNLFVADQGNNRIRKIDSQGNVSTVAGNGHGGDMDGTAGPNGTAELSSPITLAVDSNGNIFFTENSNLVRQIDTGGNVSTIAGLGTTVQFHTPSGIALDGFGNIFVGDKWNNRIMKVDTSGNVSVAAGNGFGWKDGTGGADGTATFWLPGGVACDGANDVYVADSFDNRVRKIDIHNQVTTPAGNGTGGFKDGTGGAKGTAEFNSPQGIASDVDGVLYVADTGNNSVRRVDVSGNVITFAGNGGAGLMDGTGGGSGTAELKSPQGVALGGDGYLYIADSGNNCIRKVGL
jgi:sugar lactone lactonase YvrE